MKTLASTVNCPYCGKLTDPNLDGCPHCGGYIKKKLGAAPKAASTSPQVHCPSCKGPVNDGDIICVACGTNLLTGQKIADAPRLSDASSVDVGWMERALKPLIILCLVIMVGGGGYFLTFNPVKKAEKLAAAGQFPEAQALLDQSISTNPDNAAAHHALGKLQRRASQHQDAAASFKKAFELNPENTDSGLLAVLALHESRSKGVISHQITILELLTESVPNDAKALYLLGMAYGTRANAGDHDKQISTLETVLSLSPDMESAQLGLGIAETLQGNYSQAERSLEGISSSEYKQKADISRGYIAQYNGDVKSSLELFASALSANGGASPIDAQLELAKLYIQNNDFSTAESLLRQVLQSDPLNQLGGYLMGLSMHSNGHTNEALAQYKSLISAEKGYEGPAAVQAAGLYLILNDPESAQRTISIARKANVETPAYYTVKGRIDVANQLNAQAINAFDTAIKMAPSYAPAYLERGLYHIGQNDLDAGLADLNSYLQLVGGDSTGTRVREVRVLATQLHNTLRG